MQPLRVCFVAGTLGQGGAERQLFYMLRALKQAGASPVVLSLTSGEFWEPSIKALGIPVEWVGRCASKAMRLCALSAAVLRWKPNLIQSQHPFANVYAAAVGRTFRIPVIAAVRNDFTSEIKGEASLARRWSYRYAKVVAANSKAALLTARKSGIPRGELVLLPNVVDTDEFLPVSRPKQNPVRILSVGRLVPQKRHDRLLRVSAELRRAMAVEFRVTIVGAGADRPALEALAASLGLLPDTLRIAAPGANMRDVYGQHDILALTSDHEGTPNVVLEAMAAGLPVVSTRVGDAAEIVQDGLTGFLVETSDEQGLVDRLSKLLNSRELRLDLGLRARRRVEENYALNRLPAYLGSLYQTALAR